MSNELVKFEPQTVIDLVEVAAFVITGPDSAEIAVEYREGVKALVAEIEAAYRPHVARAHQAHKALLADLQARLLPAKVALDAITRALGNYELQRRQREEQLRRDAEAAAIREAEENRAKDAEAARRKGDEALARDIEASPTDEFMAPVVVPREAKTAGVAVEQRYGIEVTNLGVLLAYAMRDDVPETLRALLVQANEKGLQSLCDQMGESFAVPGVRRVALGPSVRSTRRAR